MLSRRPTDELREEGLVREVARRLQMVRKELGLPFAESVAVTVQAAGPLLRALASRRESLARDLLADPLELGEGPLDGEGAGGRGPGGHARGFRRGTGRANARRAGPSGGASARGVPRGGPSARGRAG